MARNTSFNYKGKAADLKQIARELGVRCGRGQPARGGQPVRISCQLVEAASGQHLWADRFDGTLDDSFDLPDRITKASLARSAVLREAEIEPAGRKSETEQDAGDVTLRAFPPTFAEAPECSEEALRLLSEALEIDSAMRLPTPWRHGVSSSAI